MSFLYVSYQRAPIAGENTSVTRTDCRRKANVERLAHSTGGRESLRFMARTAGLHLLADRLPDGGGMSRPVLLVGHADLAASRRVGAVADALAQQIIDRRAELEMP